MAGGAEEDDGVALIHETAQLALFLGHPGAGAVNHLKPALCRTPEYLGGYPMCANDNGGARSDLIEVVNVLNAAGTQVGNQPLVVNDMPEGMGIFSGGAGDLGLIYGLTDAIADAGALRELVERGAPAAPRGGVADGASARGRVAR